MSKAETLKAQLEAKIAEGKLTRSNRKTRLEWILDNLICRFRSSKYFEIAECIETGEKSHDGVFKEVVVAMAPKAGEHDLRSATAVMVNDSSEFVLVLDKKTDFQKFLEIVEDHVEAVEKECCYWVADPQAAWRKRGAVLAARDERRQQRYSTSEEETVQSEEVTVKPTKKKGVKVA